RYGARSGSRRRRRGGLERERCPAAQADGMRICTELPVRHAAHGGGDTQAPPGTVSDGSGVTADMAEMRRVDADRGQDLFVFVLDIAVEQKICRGRTGEPAVACKFGLELAGAPAGISERQQRMLWTSAEGNGP